MSLTNLIRLGGVATAVAGVVLIFANLVACRKVCHLEDKELGVANWAGHVSIGNGLVLLSILLILVGLLEIMFYTHRAGVSGSTLALVGFLVGTFGLLLVVGMGGGWVQHFVEPTMSQKASDVLKTNQLAGPLPLRFTLSLALIAVVWALLGAATSKALVQPQMSAVLLIVGALLLPIPLLMPLFATYIILSAYVVALSYIVSSPIPKEAAKSLRQ